MHLKQRTLKLLQKIGLSASEAKFYWEAQKSPGKSIKTLQQNAGISSSSAYRAFESLKNKGLILPTSEHWQQSVKVSSLKRLRMDLVKEQINLRKIELQLKEVDELMKISSFSALEEPLEILFGKYEMQEKAQSLLYKKQNYFYVYGSLERLMDTIGPEVEQEFIRTRVKKGIYGDGCITEEGSFYKEIKPNNGKELRNLKLTPDAQNTHHLTYVFEDEVVRWQYDQDLGARAIVLRDPALVELCLEKFKRMWNGPAFPIPAGSVK